MTLSHQRSEISFVLWFSLKLFLAIYHVFSIFICNYIQGERLLVSTDSDLTWLSLFLNLSSPTHQLVGVPVYEDGGTCGIAGGGGIPVRERKSFRLSLNFFSLLNLFQMHDHAKLSGMGDVTNRLKSNIKTRCPKL